MRGVAETADASGDPGNGPILQVRILPPLLDRSASTKEDRMIETTIHTEAQETGPSFDDARILEVHQAARDIAFVLGKHHGYSHFGYADESLRINTYSDSSHVTVALELPPCQVFEASPYRQGGEWIANAQTARPGAWVDYLRELAKLAREVQAANARAAAEEEAARFLPVDDAQFFAGVTPQLPQAKEDTAPPAPTVGEQLVTLIRRIIRDEIPDGEL